MVCNDTFAILKDLDMFPISMQLVGFSPESPSVINDITKSAGALLPVKGATLDLTPPTPRPISKNDATRPPKPAPASSAGGMDVRVSSRIPQRYILKILDQLEYVRLGYDSLPRRDHKCLIRTPMAVCQYTSEDRRGVAYQLQETIECRGCRLAHS